MGNPTTLNPNVTGYEQVDNIMGGKAKVIVTMFAPEYNREVSAICVLKMSRSKKVNKSFNRDSSKVCDTNVQAPQQKAPKKPVV
jgi:hypothetical protein